MDRQKKQVSRNHPNKLRANAADFFELLKGPTDLNKDLIRNSCGYDFMNLHQNISICMPYMSFVIIHHHIMLLFHTSHCTLQVNKLPHAEEINSIFYLNPLFTNGMPNKELVLFIANILIKILNLHFNLQSYVKYRSNNKMNC